MITYCTKCKINWAKLHADESLRDDHEFCPVCRTDMFLEEGNSLTAYIMNPVSGKITEVETGEELILPAPLVKPFRITKAKPAMTLTKAEYERKEDAGLEAYHKSGNPEDFFKAYRQ